MYGVEATILMLVAQSGPPYRFGVANETALPGGLGGTPRASRPTRPGGSLIACRAHENNLILRTGQLFHSLTVLSRPSSNLTCGSSVPPLCGRLLSASLFSCLPCC